MKDRRYDNGSMKYRRETDIAIAEMKKDISFINSSLNEIKTDIHTLVECSQNNKSDIKIAKTQTGIQWWVITFLAGIIAAFKFIFKGN